MRSGMSFYQKKKRSGMSKLRMSPELGSGFFPYGYGPCFRNIRKYIHMSCLISLKTSIQPQRPARVALFNIVVMLLWHFICHIQTTRIQYNTKLHNNNDVKLSLTHVLQRLYTQNPQHQTCDFLKILLSVCYLLYYQFRIQSY